MAKDHYVPRHYLRQFALLGLEETMVSQIAPYRHLGRKGLGWACQQVDFYEREETLNRLIWTTENHSAPVLENICQTENITEPELNGLRWFAVTLHVRTKKAAEAHKVFPKRIAYEVIKSGIKRGKLPPPREAELSQDMVDFKGVPGFLFKLSIIPCAMEMQTLACKLLKCSEGDFFVTSDNPVMILNQFCSKDTFRSHAGFSKAGFQLLLPISPKLCAFFYDPNVYKVGSRRNRHVTLSKDDVEIVNALQVQSADEFIFFDDPKAEDKVRMLVADAVSHRVPTTDWLKTFSGRKQGEQLLHFMQPCVRLPRVWGFCRLRRHIRFRVGDRRNPEWTSLIDELMEDCEKNPNDADISTRIERILANPNFNL